LTEADVSQAGAMRLQSPNAVVASYHVAYPAFTKARKLGCRTVLNYPIAHHAWQYKLYANCAEQYPQFAQALPRFGSVQEHAALLDREIALADVILVGSQFVKNTFISEGIPAGKVRVIPYGADPQRFQPAAEPRPESGPFRVLFVGQIGERKGISHLLKAYARFCKPDTELHLVGNYVAGAEVYAPWRNHYQHTPNVPQTQLPEIFRSADVFVLPTLVEGMPMVVLEAMACGLPVVVTPNGPAEVVRDGIDGFVVPSGDSDAIVASLERLYADRSLRLEMGRNATQQATQWPWSRYARAAADEVLAI
jgi:glycosyltransferase involved in cell wall biosynthesis